ncbi:MAG: hypothetical protein AAB491_02225 [Patescibacteria group bacterium]
MSNDFSRELKYFCHITGKEGTVKTPHSALEICPACGRLIGKKFNECNTQFTPKINLFPMPVTFSFDI